MVRTPSACTAAVSTSSLTPALDQRVLATDFGQPGEYLVARQTLIAVNLGADHLDSGARRAHADFAVRCDERLQQAHRVRRAGGAGYAEEDPHTAPAGRPITCCPSRPRGRSRAREAAGR